MVNYIEYEDEDDTDSSEDPEDQEAEVAVAELMRGRPYTCKALTKPVQVKEGEKIAKSNTTGRPERKFEFDVSKTEQIFDLMLKDKLIRLPAGHKIPSKDELKNRKYCKWHDLGSHDTNNCVSLRIAIQGAIKEGDLKFAKAGVHAVDDNPFPEVAMVGVVSLEITNEKSRGKRPIEGESSRTQPDQKEKRWSEVPREGRQQSRDLKEDIKPKEGAFRGRHPESEWISPEEMQRFCNMNGRPMYCAGCNRGLAKPITIQRRPALERLGPGEDRKRARPESFTTATRESSGVRFEVKLPIAPKSPKSRFELGAYTSRSYREGRMDRPKVEDRFRSLARARQNTEERLPDRYTKAKIARDVREERHLSRYEHRSNERRPRSDRPSGSTADREKLYRPVSPRFVKPKVEERPIWRRVVHPKFPRQGSRILTRTQKRRLQRSLAETRRTALEKRVRLEEKPTKLDAMEGRVEASSVKTEAEVEDTKRAEDDMEIESSGINSPLGSNFEVLTEDESDGDGKRLEKLSLQFGSPPPKAPVNMVSILPLDFMAKDEQLEVLEDDVDDETEPVLSIMREVMAVEEKNVVTFDKPEGKAARHLKPLYIKIHLDGKPVSRVLVDNGAAINIITTAMMRRLGKQDSELKPAPMTIMSFMGKAEKSKGILVAEVTVGEKTKTTGFYVVDAAANYNVLLGRDWIHTSLCVPSSLHQCLLLWNGNQVEKVMADDQPFENAAYMAEIKFYNGEYTPTDYEGNGRDIQEQAVLSEDFSWF